MSESIQKVRSGDPLRIPASSYNAFVDAAKDFQTRSIKQGAAPERSARHSGIIFVRNMTQSDRARFDILGISAPVFSSTDNPESFQNDVVFDGVTPATLGNAHVGRFVVLLEPVKAGGVAQAMISGVVVCQVNIVADGDKFADISDGDSSCLKSGSTGAAQILWKPSGTGTMWAIVRLGNPAADQTKGTEEFQIHQMRSLGGVLTDTWDWARGHFYTGPGY